MALRNVFKDNDYFRIVDVSSNKDVNHKRITVSAQVFDDVFIVQDTLNNKITKEFKEGKIILTILLDDGVINVDSVLSSPDMIEELYNIIKHVVFVNNQNVTDSIDEQPDFVINTTDDIVTAEEAIRQFIEGE